MPDRTASSSPSAAAVSMRGVEVRRFGRRLLSAVDWHVQRGERWVVIGPNGSGKTTLLRLAAAELHPTEGVVEVLGHQLGRVDVRSLKARVGFVSGALLRELRPSARALDVVVAGSHGARETWWHKVGPSERTRAARLLADAGLDGAEEAPIGVLSEGERQQVLLARALMADPDLLLLDEPAAGLDLGARERLVATVEHLACGTSPRTLVLVTHHVEEVPRGTTHAALMREGRLLAAGPLEEVLTAEALSACFALPVVLSRADGRYAARARLDP